jgi:hypothetical protein
VCLSRKRRGIGVIFIEIGSGVSAEVYYVHLHLLSVLITFMYKRLIPMRLVARYVSAVASQSSR